MAEHDDAHHMQCMEVWGGNQLADSGVVMAGLDAWVYSKPYGGAEGGGDVYYVSSCATGRIVRLLVADVSGHGAKVSQIATGLRSLMRKHVNQIDQARFVRSMNEQFQTLASLGSFATAVVTTFFAPTNHLSLCNAGHPPPLIYRGATKTWGFLEHKPAVESAEPGNVPLGILDLTQYDQFDVKLKVGDLVLCYTDSLMEARDASGEMLGTQGLLELVRTLDTTDPTQLTTRLLATVETRCGQELCDDDVTVLLFRPNGLAPNTPIKERLLAPFRVLRSWAFPDLKLANVGGAMFPALNRLWTRQRERQGVVDER
jgi:serine phosphatase RsbU (regulator of sigma subunit)